MMGTLRRHIILLSLTALSLFITPYTTAQAIIYVNQSATGANDGTSWVDAFTFLQDVLSVAQPRDEIWVSTGKYRPDQGSGYSAGDRDASFMIPDGVSVFGGFSGVETDPAQRNWRFNATILSGDLLKNDSGPDRPDNPLKSDNSRHVVLVNSPTMEVTLDGLFITNGFVDDQASAGGSAVLFENQAVPGGILRIRNCHIYGNTGVRSTVTVSGSSFSPELSFILEDSRIENNWADFAAGLDVSASHISIERSSISQNEAVDVSAIYMTHSTAFISHSTIAFNESDSGGAIFVDGEDSGLLSIWSSHIVGNTSLSFGAGAITLSESHLESFNSVYSGNTAAREGGAFQLANYSALLVNNVFAYNEAGLRGGAIASFDKQSTTIVNSIFWENSAPEEVHYYSFGVDTIRVFNRIATGGVNQAIIDEGSFWDVDPLFANPLGADNIAGTSDDDFQLSLGSPAIDSGDNSLLPPDILDSDLDGDIQESLSADILENTRIVDGGSGISNVDLGPYEFDAPPIVMANDRNSEERPKSQNLIINYPNPFSVSTTISYSVSTLSEVSLEIYNILGHQVRVLEQGFREAGEHSVQLDAEELGTGVYFVRLSAGSNSQTRKMVVMR